MTQDNTQLISKSAVKFLSGTFLSRCSGLMRDLSMAFCFGSHPAVAAFMVAFRFANLFRRLFGEGALPASFIPHFESVRRETPEKATQFFRDLFFTLSLFLISLILISECFLFALLKLDLFSADSAEIVRLTMLVLPGVLFICLFGLMAALLQCEKKFFLSGVAPIAFNATWIGTVWWLKDLPINRAMMGLAFSVIVAFAMQWLLTMKGYWKWLFIKEKIALFSREIRDIIKPLFLSILGVGAVQINSFLDSLFARFASLEGPAYLWYAIRLEQLPLALFGIALSSALLPPLSRAIQAGDKSRYLELLSFGLKRSLQLMLPCTIGILVLGSAGVNLLYGRGDFNQQATFQTVLCLWGYGLGLVPSVYVILLASSFYAQKKYALPMMASCYAVLVNLTLNALFVFFFNWGAFSIAVATSLSSFFNLWILARNHEEVSFALLVQGFGKVAFYSLLAGGTALALFTWLGDPTWAILQGKEVLFSRHFGQQLFQCMGMGLVYVGILWLGLWRKKEE